MERDDATPITEQLTAYCEQKEGHWVLSNPSVETVLGLIRALEAASDPPKVSVLGRNEVLREVRHNFEMGCRAAKLIRDDALELRVSECGDLSTLLLAPTEGFLVVVLDGHADLLGVSDSEWVCGVHDEVSSEIESASSYDPRCPPLDEVFQTASEHLGKGFASDFESVLAHARANGRQADVHAVIMAILVGAKHELQNYEVARWVEDAGVASTASVSRHKTKLESRGLVTTEKVSVDLGRPRQRLLLSDEAQERTQDESFDEFVLQSF